MQLDWDDLRTVLCVVRGRSLAEAGKVLAINYTTVARRISRAERKLGQQLFERLPDGYVPTEAGRLAAEYAAKMEAEQEALLLKLKGQDQTLRGQLTVTAPQLLIAHGLTTVIDQFCLAHPEVELVMRATNEILDLNRREADLAIRISRSPGDSLTGLRLADQHSASFADQTWADRIAKDTSTPIDWVVYTQLDHLPKGIDPTYPNHRIKLRLDDMMAIVGAAQAGLGVIRAPMFLGRGAPGLVQVPVLPPQPYAEIWVVGHRDVWPSAKVAAFRDILVAHMRATRDLYVA